MSAPTALLSLNIGRAEQALDEYIKEHLAACVPVIQSRQRTDVTKFLSFMIENAKYMNGSVLLTESLVIKWMRCLAERCVVLHTATVFWNVNRFLEALVAQGVVCENLMASINTRYGKRGWLAISKALHSPQPQRALDALPVESPFKGGFGNLSKAYLELKQSSGPQCLHPKNGS